MPRYLAWLSSAALALASACGANTALEEDPCGDAGALRSCMNACGEGVQVCQRGSWSACRVEATQLPCTNACGAGVAECVDGVAAACAVPIAERMCSSLCGEGIEVCTDGAWGPCSADVPLPPRLAVVVRDFREAHPDFEGAALGSDRGFVSARLGPDDKPVYLGPSPTTTGAANFDTWYRSVPGVNEAVIIDLPLTPVAGEAGRFLFDDLEFFPIDDAGFGNEGREHNFHFTLEAVADFVYNGGEMFRFAGDDDVFVFINRRLAIDLGGVHSREEASVLLDEVADEFELVIGGTYALHLFFAERHTSRSTFTIDTTITRTPRCE